MYKISQDLVKKLNNFNQRKLCKGEIFLLAKAIADKLPLMPPDETNVNLFLLNHKRFIIEVIDCLNNYTYLAENEVKTIEKLIGNLTIWRYTVAYNPSTIYFRNSGDSAIDDISLLPKYVDITYMSSVSDLVSRNTANYITNLFNEFVTEVKNCILEDSSASSDLDN